MGDSATAIFLQCYKAPFIFFLLLSGSETLPSVIIYQWKNNHRLSRELGHRFDSC